jgi:hypothetical protein
VTDLELVRHVAVLTAGVGALLAADLLTVALIAWLATPGGTHGG